MITQLTRNWQLLALRGLIAVLYSLAALVWPGALLKALGLLFGAYALADGLLALVVSWLDRHEFYHGWTLLLRGLAGIALGVLICLWPSVTIQALVSLIAAWAILTGVFEAVAVLDLRNVVEGERQMAWDNLIEREMMRTP
jgi:uncharacterized membrane protein HdeD (DUF308 family)